MNANQLLAILNSIKVTVSDDTWTAAVKLSLSPADDKPAAKPAAKPAKPADDKPKRVLTEEHKAKMQAGRVAKKAAKEGAASGEEAEKPVAKPADDKPKRVLTEEHKAKMQAGRIAKKAAKEGAASGEEADKPAAKPAEKPAALVIPPNRVAEAMSENPVTEEIKIAGKTYIRLADGRCYEPGTIDGELGAWAGLFKNGVLDTTAREE
jgi:hypothetical protein